MVNPTEARSAPHSVPSPSQRGWLGATSAAAVAAFLYGYVQHSAGWRSFAATGNGYAAKLACGAVFGADRTLQSVLDAELVFPPAKYGRRFELDEEKKCLTVYGTWPTNARGKHHTTACWRGHRLGCHITEIDGASTSTAPDGALYAVSPGLRLDDDAGGPGGGASGGGGGPDSAANTGWPLGDKVGTPAAGAALATARGRVDLEALEKHVDSHFADARLHTRAVLLLVDGQVVFEKYGDGCDRHTRLLGWSATKSIVNALVGARVHQMAEQHGYSDSDGDGDSAVPRFTLDSAVADFLPEWRLKDVAGVTVRQMLQMSDGLDGDEQYFPGLPVTEMLFAHPAAGQAAIDAATLRPGGTGCFHYSSVTTNCLCKALGNTFAGGPAEALAFPTEALFRPLGMRSARLETDGAGVFQGSSFGWATARDWARLALLFMYDGMWWPERAGADADPGGRTRRILPEGWVNFSSTPTPTSRGQYGAHFWVGGFNATEDASAPVKACDGVFPTRLNPPKDWLRASFPPGTFLMHGFEEQCIAMTPKQGIVLLRMGATKEVVLSWNKTVFYQGVYKTIDTLSAQP